MLRFEAGDLSNGLVSTLHELIDEHRGQADPYDGITRLVAPLPEVNESKKRATSSERVGANVRSCA